LVRLHGVMPPLHGDVVHIGHVWTLDQGECWTMTGGWSNEVDNNRGVIAQVQVLLFLVKEF
jgi:hypothetical protein